MPLPCRVIEIERVHALEIFQRIGIPIPRQRQSKRQRERACRPPVQLACVPQFAEALLACGPIGTCKFRPAGEQRRCFHSLAG
jgi:hypothetical protein